MTRAIGIDLGTTNSVVASISRGKPRVIPNGLNQDWTPSLVGRRDGGFVVGQEVETQIMQGSASAAHSVKRLMGRRFSDEKVAEMIAAKRFHFVVVEHPEHPGEIGIELGGLILTPAEISAQVLRALRDDAERDLGESVGHAVITVPAYFRDPSIVATREAGRLAGLRVQHVMPEPTAAALAYALGEDESIEGVRHILVYDFGGGTFDVSVLVAVPGTPLQVLSVDGDNFLGGDDIDSEIARLWDREMRTDLGVSIFDGTGIAANGPYPLMSVQWILRHAAREAKERLGGAAPSRSITKPALIQRDDGTLLSPTWTLTRDVLAGIVGPKIDETFAVVERALASANLNAADIHDVVVVGGSTKLAGVLEQLRAMFPSAEIRNSINPMLVVGIGAAQQTRMALPWACPACGRANEATTAVCVGCGADADQPEHDCEVCGAIFASGDTSCPNPACQTRIVRPAAPVEVLSHSIEVQLVGGDWVTLVDRGTPVFPSRKEAATPSVWIELAAHRTGQSIELPIGQQADDRGKDPTPIAHFQVVEPPSGLVAGDRVAVRLVLDGDRAVAAEVEIAGTLYGTRRVDYSDAAETAGSEDEGSGGSSRATWYRFLATGAAFLPRSARNPSTGAFMDELRAHTQALEEIADRIEAAEASGDKVAVERLCGEADEFINENLPIVPSLAMAAMMANVSDDLDARRDLQAGIEDVRQALSTGGADDAGNAFQSLQSVMSEVVLPDHDVVGVDANLLTRMRK